MDCRLIRAGKVAGDWCEAQEAEVRTQMGTALFSDGALVTASPEIIHLNLHLRSFLRAGNSGQIYHSLKLEQVTDMIFNMVKVETCHGMQCPHPSLQPFSTRVGRNTLPAGALVSSPQMLRGLAQHQFGVILGQLGFGPITKKKNKKIQTGLSHTRS